MDDVFWLYIAYVYIYAVSQFMFVVVGQKHALKLRFPLMYVFGGVCDMEMGIANPHQCCVWMGLARLERPGLRCIQSNAWCGVPSWVDPNFQSRSSLLECKGLRHRFTLMSGRTFSFRRAHGSSCLILLSNFKFWSCQIRGLKEIVVYPFVDYARLYPFPTTHPCDRQCLVSMCWLAVA